MQADPTPISSDGAAVGSQDGRNWAWQVSENETASKNLHAYMTSKCWTGFWPYIALAWAEDLWTVTFFFISCRDPDSLVRRFNSCLWGAIATIRNPRVRPMSMDFQQQMVSAGK